MTTDLTMPMLRPRAQPMSMGQVGRAVVAMAALWVASTLGTSAIAAQVRAWDATVMPPLAFTQVDGSAFDVTPLAGKIVVLNFWATWCGPCRAEMPVLQRVADARAKQSVEVLLVNAIDSPTAINHFLTKLPLNLPVLRLLPGTEVNWRQSALPATVVLDAQSRPRWVVVGKLDEDGEPLRSLLDQMVAQNRSTRMPQMTAKPVVGALSNTPTDPRKTL